MLSGLLQERFVLLAHLDNQSALATLGKIVNS